MNFRTQFQHVFGIEWVVAVVVFAGVLGLVLVAVVWRRARPGRLASRTESYTRSEALWAAAVFAVAIFLVVTTSSANTVERSSVGRPSMTVDITAFQWCWRFSYPGTGVTVTGDCTTGDYPTMVVPVDRTIEVRLVSEDVVHEWFLPYLHYKEEAFPDHVNSFPLRMTRTGSWTGQCSEFCGLYHSSMFFHLRAVSPAAFASWLASRSGRPAPVPSP